MSVCPACGVNNADGIAYCPYCGAAQSQKPAWQSEPVVVTMAAPTPPPAPAPVDVWESNPDPKPEQVTPIAWQTAASDTEPVTPASWQAPGITAEPVSAPVAPTPVYPAETETAVWAQPEAPAKPSKVGKIMSIISMATGIASLVTGFGGTSGIALGIAALVTRSISRKKGGGNPGMLRAGLICGICGIVVGAIAALFSSILSELFLGIIEGIFEFGSSDFYI